MIGFLPRTLPCIFEEIAPPKESSSAPVCFCIMDKGVSSVFWLLLSHSINLGQLTPDPTFTLLEVGFKF